jgi:hypothetical protein
MRKLVLPFLISGALASGIAFADTTTNDEEQHRHHHALPEEAFTACNGMNEGDACTAKPRGTEVKGQCTMGHQTRLWCRPSSPPPRDRPPE